MLLPAAAGVACRLRLRSVASVTACLVSDPHPCSTVMVQEVGLKAWQLSPPQHSSSPAALSQSQLIGRPVPSALFVLTLVLPSPMLQAIGPSVESALAFALAVCT